MFARRSERFRRNEAGHKIECQRNGDSFQTSGTRYVGRSVDGPFDRSNTRTTSDVGLEPNILRKSSVGLKIDLPRRYLNIDLFRTARKTLQFDDHYQPAICDGKPAKDKTLIIAGGKRVSNHRSRLKRRFRWRRQGGQSHVSLVFQPSQYLSIVQMTARRKRTPCTPVGAKRRPRSSQKRLRR